MLGGGRQSGANLADPIWPIWQILQSGQSGNLAISTVWPIWQTSHRLSPTNLATRSIWKLILQFMPTCSLTAVASIWLLAQSGNLARGPIWHSPTDLAPKQIWQSGELNNRAPNLANETIWRKHALPIWQTMQSGKPHSSHNVDFGLANHLTEC